MTMSSRSPKPGGPASTSGAVRRADELGVEQEERQPGEMVAVEMADEHVETALGSTCHLRIATIEEAPQSTSTLPRAARSR